VKIFGVPYQRRQLLLLVTDVLAIVLAVVAGQLPWYLSGRSETFPLLVFDQYGWASGFFLVSTIAMLSVGDAYNTQLDFRRRFEVFRLVLAVVLAAVLQLLAFALFPNHWWGRGMALSSTLGLALVLPALRAVFSAVSPRPTYTRASLIIGQGRAAQQVCKAMEEMSDGSFQVVGLLRHDRAHSRRHNDRPEDSLHDLGEACEQLGDTGQLLQMAGRYQVDHIVVAVRGSLGSELTEALLACKRQGIEVEDMATVYKRLTGKLPLLSISKNSLIFGSGFTRMTRSEQAMMRLTDLVLAGIGATLTLPVVALAALAVKLTSRGPVFYRQERLGKDERPFHIVKLRTMRTDAEGDGVPKWSQGNGDPRVTPIGRFLRRTRIDELPQFYNVLRGDMSMVGPRPERAYFIEQLKRKVPFYELRFAVAPGVTGWAQVKYGYGSNDDDAAEKLSYELYAIQEMNPVLYLVILIKTVQTVLLRPGS
jgi:exopolysaccharide biosynthesis polyprenyl glycosylphosphotransferase